MRRSHILAAVLYMLILSSSCSLASQSKEHEEFHQTHGLTAGGTLSLKNVNGSVTIRAWDDQRVEIHAIKTGPSQDKLQMVKIEVNVQPDRIDIETVYPKHERNLNVSVKYELMVPGNVNLERIETVNGSIDISGVQGRIQARTVNGSINIEGSKVAVDAETVNGSVKAALLDLPAGERVSLQTVNGGLTLYLPEWVNADVRAETVNGRINSELPVMVSGRIGPKHLAGKIGSGGAQLKLETVNGSITIARGKS